MEPVAEERQDAASNIHCSCITSTMHLHPFTSSSLKQTSRFTFVWQNSGLHVKNAAFKIPQWPQCIGDHHLCDLPHRISWLSPFMLCTEDWTRHLSEDCQDYESAMLSKVGCSYFLSQECKRVHYFRDIAGCVNKLPREVVAAPSLIVFKVRLYGALSNLI